MGTASVKSKLLLVQNQPEDECETQGDKLTPHKGLRTTCRAEELEALETWLLNCLEASKVTDQCRRAKETATSLAKAPNTAQRRKISASGHIDTMDSVIHSHRTVYD